MARWKMLSGKFYYKGKKYVAGDVFEASPYDVRGIRDIIQPLDKVEEYQDFQEDDVPRKKLEAIHRGFGKWDVVNNTTGENVNDQPLTKAEAKQLVENLLDEEEQQKAQAEVAKEKEELKQEVDESKKEQKDGKEKPSYKKTTGNSATVEKKRRIPIGRGTKSEQN